MTSITLFACNMYLHACVRINKGVLYLGERVSLLKVNDMIPNDICHKYTILSSKSGEEPVSEQELGTDSGLRLYSQITY